MKAYHRTERDNNIIGQVVKLFKEHYSLTDISRILGCSITLVRNVVSDHVMAKRALGFSVIDTSVSIGQREMCYASEDDIRQSLEPLYDPSELTGWELKQFNKPK